MHTDKNEVFFINKKNNVKMDTDIRKPYQEIFDYQTRRSKEELKIVNYFHNRQADFLRKVKEPILADVLEDEFRF